MRKEILFTIAVILFSLSIVSALTVTIDVKESFSKGEIIEFNYKITSDEVTEIEYIEDIACPDASRQMLVTRTVEVGPDSPVEETFRYFEVTEKIEPQSCIAYIQILSPIEQQFREEFSIDTFPPMTFDALACKDSLCETESKIFLRNKNVYLSYESNPDNPAIQATLTYPDGTRKQIDIPTSIIASQIGTYELEVTASKEGYVTASDKLQFGVIEKEAEIEEIEVPPLKEASQEPASETELPPGVEEPEKGKSYVYYTLAALIIIAVVAYFVLRKRKRG